MHGERTRVSDGVRNRCSGGEYNNQPLAASTAVEIPFMVMAAVVDAATAPDAGNSGSGVYVGSGETAVTIVMATATVTVAMTTTAAETAVVAATTTPASAAASAAAATMTTTAGRQ